MAEILFDADINMSGVGKLVRALLNPVASDPGSPAEGEVWYNTTDDRLKVRANGISEELAYFSEVSAGGVPSTTWDAQSTVIAITDDTPVAQTFAANTYLGRRATGDLTAVTLANLATDLEGTGLEASTLGGIAAGAFVQEADYDANSTLVAVADNTPVVQAFAASTVLGRRSTGDVTAISYVNLIADLEAVGIDADTLGGTAAADYATDAEVAAAIAALVDTAPGTLDTLNELAAALGDDPNFATTVTNSLATKVNSFSANFGNAAAQSFNIDHNLGTLDVQVQTFVNSSGAEVVTGVARTTTNRVVVTTNSVPGSNAYRVVVQGRA